MIGVNAMKNRLGEGYYFVEGKKYCTYSGIGLFLVAFVERFLN